MPIFLVGRVTGSLQMSLIALTCPRVSQYCFSSNLIPVLELNIWGNECLFYFIFFIMQRIVKISCLFIY